MDSRSKSVNIWTRGVRWLVLASAAALGALLLWSGLSRPVADLSSGGHMLADWDYTWAEQADSATSGRETLSAGKDSPIRRFGQGDYLFLSREIPAADAGRRLMITTGNAPLRVAVDGQTVLDTLGSSGSFVGNRVSAVTLPASSSKSRLTATVFCPYRLEFSACLIPMDQLSNIDGVSIYTSTSFVIAFAVLGGVLLIMAGLQARRPWRRQLRAAGALALFSAAACFFNQSVPTLSAFHAPLFYRIHMLSLVLLSAATVFLLSSRQTWNRAQEVMLGGSLLLGLLLALSPYEPLTLLVAKYYGFWHLAAGAAALLSFLRIGRKPDSSVGFVLTAALFFVETAFWMDSLIGIAVNLRAPVFFGVVLVSAAGIIEGLRLMKAGAAASLPPEATHSAPVDFAFGYQEGHTVVLESLKKLMSIKCDTENHHTVHVAEYVRVMCRTAGMSAEEADYVANAALLHDIGKIVIPPDVLFKEEKLTAVEFEQIQCHVLYGYHILCGSQEPFFQLAANIAREHHERFDGSGYLGLHGREIDRYARMTAVADVFDALTTERTYKKAWSFEDGFLYILDHAGDFFDPEIVQLFEGSREEIEAIYRAENVRKPAVAAEAT